MLGFLLCQPEDHISNRIHISILLVDRDRRGEFSGARPYMDVEEIP
jgi:hypothetical protein